MKTKLCRNPEPQRFGALCVVAVVTACSSTTTTRMASSPVAERRLSVDANAPVVTSTWMFDSSKITGHVNWASCVSQRSWTTEQQRIVHYEPIPLVVGGLLVGGSALFGLGIATHDFTFPEQACPSDPIEYNLQMLYGPSCGHGPNNDASDAELITGAIAIAVGLATFAARPKDQIQTQSQSHAETATGPCISTADLATLSLVLKLGEKQFLHVALEPSGDASIELPAHLPVSARPKPGSDLPVVVYRAPPGAANVLSRWQVVGTVHVPE